MLRKPRSMSGEYWTCSRACAPNCSNCSYWQDKLWYKHYGQPPRREQRSCGVPEPCVRPKHSCCETSTSSGTTLSLFCSESCSNRNGDCCPNRNEDYCPNRNEDCDPNSNEDCDPNRNEDCDPNRNEDCGSNKNEDCCSNRNEDCCPNRNGDCCSNNDNNCYPSGYACCYEDWCPNVKEGGKRIKCQESDLRCNCRKSCSLDSCPVTTCPSDVDYKRERKSCIKNIQMCKPSSRRNLAKNSSCHSVGTKNCMRSRPARPPTCRSPTGDAPRLQDSTSSKWLDTVLEIFGLKSKGPRSQSVEKQRVEKESERVSQLVASYDRRAMRKATVPARLTSRQEKRMCMAKQESNCASGRLSQAHRKKGEIKKLQGEDRILREMVGYPCSTSKSAKTCSGPEKENGFSRMFDMFRRSISKSEKVYSKDGLKLVIGMDEDNGSTCTEIVLPSSKAEGSKGILGLVPPFILSIGSDPCCPECKSGNAKDGTCKPGCKQEKKRLERFMKEDSVIRKMMGFPSSRKCVRPILKKCEDANVCTDMTTVVVE